MKYKVRFIGWSDTWAALNKLSTPTERLTLAAMLAFVPALTTWGKQKEEMQGVQTGLHEH